MHRPPHLCADQPLPRRPVSASKNLQGDARTGLGIGQGMVMMLQIEAAGRGDRMQLVVGQPLSEDAARGPAGAQKTVSGIGHAVEVENGPQAPLVEGRVVRDERKPLDARRHLPPDLLEIGRILRIGGRQSVNRRRETAVIVRARVDQAVEGIANLTAAHDDHTDRADARPAAVGRFEIDGCKIGHCRDTGFFPAKINTPKRKSKSTGGSPRKENPHPFPDADPDCIHDGGEAYSLSIITHF